LTEKNKYRFKGHESFILREGWLNKGLFEIEKNAKVFSENKFSILFGFESAIIF